MSNNWFSRSYNIVLYITLSKDFHIFVCTCIYIKTCQSVAYKKEITITLTFDPQGHIKTCQSVAYKKEITITLNFDPQGHKFDFLYHTILSCTELFLKTFIFLYAYTLGHVRVLHIRMKSLTDLWPQGQKLIFLSCKFQILYVYIFKLDQVSSKKMSSL
jgi:hypothetical protein